MKQFKSLILLLLIAFTATAQTTYHVYSTEIPWNDTSVSQDGNKLYSITQAIAMASDGDSIILHEGIYREELKVTKNNLTIKNYGDDYVLVSGSDLVSGWTAASGMEDGVMQADITGYNIETDYSQLFSDGAMQQMGRFPNNTTGQMMEPLDPNSGYGLLGEVSKEAGVNADCYATFADEAPPIVDLTGGIIRGLVGKNRHYFFGNITNSTRTGQITFTALNNGQWKEEAAIDNTYHKFGYAFIFHKNLVDVPGEWFVDGNTLYYMPQKANVNDERIELQVRKYVLTIDNKDGTSISGINFTAGLVNVSDADNSTLTDCSFRYLSPFFQPSGYGMNDSGVKGFYVENCNNTTLASCYLAHNWGSMITLRSCNNSTIENTVIKDFGWVAIFTAAVYLKESDETTISKCTMAEGARFHIRIDGMGGKVNMTDCDLYDAMKMGEDAGPVEVTSTGRIGALDLQGSTFAYNKVRDCYGIPVSAGGYLRQKITAFYMEDAENYTAHHNLVYNFMADNYTGEYASELERHGEFLYLGPRYNPMYQPVNYYNNTVWDVNQLIGIWNIEIDNWKELGLSAPDTSGCMKDGHFANNIIISGPEYKISYVRQVLSSTGGNLGYVTLNPSPSFNTTSFTDYTARVQPLGYEFNPENNVFFTSSVGNRNFVSTADADYRLQESSEAKGAGVSIEGITSSDTPDCGAFEGSDRVMYAGADLKTPNFKEDESYATAISTVQTIEFEVYPNPAEHRVTVQLDKVSLAELSLFNLSGVCVADRSFVGLQESMDVSQLPEGLYLLKIQTEKGEAVKTLIIK